MSQPETPKPIAMQSTSLPQPAEMVLPPVSTAQAGPPGISELLTQARLQVAAGDLRGGFQIFRQLLASVTMISATDLHMLTDDLARFLPVCLKQADEVETAHFMRALRLQPELAQRLVGAIEAHAAREAAALSFALGTTYAASDRYDDALAMLVVRIVKCAWVRLKIPRINQSRQRPWPLCHNLLNSTMPTDTVSQVCPS